MKLQISSPRSYIWVAAHWLLFSSWIFAAFAVGMSFVLNLMAGDEGIGISFVLAIIVVPVSLAIARRFALDSLRYSKRSVTINAEARELILRDPLWLDGKHFIPVSEVSEVSLPGKSLLGGAAIERSVLDLTSRATAKHSVYVGFKRPVEFVRCGGPVLFDLIFTFLDPGEGGKVTGMILEFRRPLHFLKACDQIGLKVVEGYTRKKDEGVSVEAVQGSDSGRPQPEMPD